MPAKTFVFSIRGISNPVIIIQEPRQERIPKYISHCWNPKIGISTAVTNVTARPHARTIIPLFTVFLDNLEQIPEIIINIAQKRG